MLYGFMKADKLRKKYLEFFESKGHKIMPSSSLVPINDPTVLFTSAGMQPLVPYLLGAKHPLGKRLCNAQKCVRTNDIDEVGDATHCTFFEMLGNWSLGDYFKKEAIEWSFEFLTKELKIKKEKLAITVFEGDDEIPKDEESAKIWESLGIPKEKIAYLGKDDNWWGPAGKTGPCGPDTEMFYWTGKDKAPKEFDAKNELWVEIWNDVFMEYNKKEDGSFEPLAQKNVDTGMGLERVVAVLQKKDNVFATELFSPLIEKIGKISDKKYKEHQREFRIIADHLKAATLILAEKISPSKIDRGYVARRLIRRAIRFGNLLGISKNFTWDIAQKVIEIYKEAYPEVEEMKGFIKEQIEKEESGFRRTLKKGLWEFEKRAFGAGKNVEKGQVHDQGLLRGSDAFYIYETYGFPPEMMKEICKERGFEFDEKGFQEALKKHKDLSRTAAAGKFKAGLADQSEKTIKYHTATHLLHSALGEVLGEQVKQMGSNITPERLRFDFSFERKLTQEEVKNVEELVNLGIQAKLMVKMEEMSIKQALESGALAFFRERYPERVKVYTIFDPRDDKVFSKEICSGPHYGNTSGLGRFKIIKETSVSSGVRRIKAILE